MGAGVQNAIEYDVTADKVNCSNIWGCISVETENADANAQGTWVLYAFNNEGARPVWDDATFDGDSSDYQYVIAFGVWSASNQMPFNYPIPQLKISRNLRKDGKLGLAVRQTGITAGNSSVRVSLSCNTTTL